MFGDALRTLRTLGRRPLKFRRTRECPTALLGTPYGRYAICPPLVDERSVVYSFGVGRDISFDEELIARSGATVHAFDPTPATIEWLKSRPTPGRFVFHEWGIAEFDGTATFHVPEDPAHVSHTMLASAKPARGAIEVPVLRLQTTMQRLGHDRIDVLKLDIEGAECSVVKDVLASGTPIGQILIEFHHHRPEVPLAAIQEAVDELECAGFERFHGNPRGYEFSFIGPDPVTRDRLRQATSS